MSNQNIGISAAMDDKSLLDSIDKTLKNVEGKFTDFAKIIEGQLGDAGNQAGLNLGNGLSNGMNSGLNDAKEKARQFRAEISKSLSEGTFSIDDTQTIKNLQIAKDEAKKLYENAAIGSKEFNEMGKTIGDVDAKLKQLNLKKVNLSGAGLSNLASASQTNATNVSDYTSAMAMGTASIQERMDKLKALKDVQRNLSTSDADYQSRISAVNKEMSNLKKANQEALASGVQLEKGNNKLMQSFENLGRRVLFYFSLGVLSGFVKQLIDIRAQYEILERSMGALLDDMDRGSQIFNEIKARALKSPFTVLQLASSAKQLIAYDFAENQVVETTSRLADISAALGVPMERLVYNLGQIRAQTVLTARDARDFANAGLPIIKKLSDMYTEQEGKVVSTGEVYSRLTKRMVSFNDVMKVLVGLTNEGGMFYDFQTKQAQTLRGQLSNLTDAYDIFLNEIGKSNQGILTTGISGIRALFNNWKAISKAVDALVISYGAYKAYQGLINITIGKGNNLLEKQILTNKKKIASDLERKQVTEQLSASELRVLQTRNVATVSDYRQILSSKQLSVQQLRFIATLNFRNTAMLQAIVRTGELSAAEVRAAASWQGLGNVFKLVGVQIKTALAGLGKFLLSSLPTVALFVAIDLLMNIGKGAREAKEKIKELNDAYSELRGNVANISSQFNIAVKDGEKTGDLTQAKAKIQELIDLAKEKYDIEITVDMSKMNVKDVIKTFNDVKSELSDIMSFSQTFSSAAANTKIADTYKKMGDSAQEYYNVLIGNKNVVASQMRDHISQLNETQKAALTSLETEKSNSESSINYLNRITKAYKDLGLIDNSSWWVVSENRIMESARAIGVSYSGVFATISDDYANFNKNFLKSTDETKKIVDILADKINIKNIPEKDRTIKLKAAIDNYSKDNALNQFAKEILYWTANQAYSVKIKTDFEGGSLLLIKDKLDDYRQQLQAYADKNHITLGVDLKTASQAEMAKSAGSTVDTLRQEIEATKNARDYAKSTGDVISANILQGKIDKDNLELNKALIVAKKEGWADTKEQAKQTKENAKAVKKENDAIKKEIDLINNLNSTYEKLTNAGWKQSDVLEYLKKQYTTSADEINKLLAKNGLKQIDLNMFKGAMTPDDIIKLLTGQLKTAKGANKINLEVEINKLTVDAAEYDVNKLSEGLQKSINDIKEGYELSLDIQQNPEMSQLFSQTFKIDFSQLPKDAADAVDKIQQELDKNITAFNENKKNKLDLFDVRGGDINTYLEKMGLGEGKNNKITEMLTNAQKITRDILKKDTEDTIKNWSSLLSKYAEFTYKKQEIEETAQKERQTIVNKYGSEDQKKLVKNLVFSYSTSTTEEQRKSIENQIKILIDDIAKSKADIIPLKIAIDRQQVEDIADLTYKEFQKTEVYIAAFDDLSKMSNKTLRTIRDAFIQFRDSQKDLSPTQIKEYERAIKNLDDTIGKNDPFAALAESFKKLKEAQDELTQAKSRADLEKTIQDEKAIAKAAADVKAAQKQVEAAIASGDPNKIADAYQNLITAQSKYQDETDKISQSDLTKAFDDLFGAQKGVDDEFSNMTDKMKSVITIAENLLVDSGLLSDIFGEMGAVGVKAFLSIASTVVTAIQAIRAAETTGSVITAILSAILAIIQAINAVFEAKDKAITDKIERLGQEIDWLKGRLDDLATSSFFDLNKRTAMMSGFGNWLNYFSKSLGAVPQTIAKLKHDIAESEKGIFSLGLYKSTMNHLAIFKGGLKSTMNGVLNILTLGAVGFIKLISSNKGLKNMRKLQKMYNDELAYSIKLNKILNNSDFSLLQKAGEARLLTLEKQNKLLREQLENEQKRKAKKRDAVKEQEYIEKINENEAEQAAVYANLIKDNYGDIFNDLASGISSALKNAFDNATDPAKAFKRFVERCYREYDMEYGEG
jgi:hypothetical protein